MSEEKEEKQPQTTSSKPLFTSDENLKRVRGDTNETLLTRIIAGAILTAGNKPKKMPKVPPGKENLS
ncbi:MAG: hypothetical protein R6V12_19040 [Candidatus Hydrogenedentota bacterium]